MVSPSSGVVEVPEAYEIVMAHLCPDAAATDRTGGGHTVTRQSGERQRADPSRSTEQPLTCRRPPGAPFRSSEPSRRRSRVVAADRADAADRRRGASAGGL